MPKLKENLSYILMDCVMYWARLETATSAMITSKFGLTFCICIFCCVLSVLLYTVCFSSLFLFVFESMVIP